MLFKLEMFLFVVLLGREREGVVEDLAGWRRVRGKGRAKRNGRHGTELSLRMCHAIST